MSDWKNIAEEVHEWQTPDAEARAQAAFRAALARARVEALEMVATEVERRVGLARRVYVGTDKALLGEGAGDALATLAASIRASIAMPAHACLPVERVRDVLGAMSAEGFITNTQEVLRRLGVPLDAATEARPPKLHGGYCEFPEGACICRAAPDDVATEPHPDAIAPERNLCACSYPRSEHDADGRIVATAFKDGRPRRVPVVVCPGFRHVEQEGPKP